MEALTKSQMNQLEKEVKTIVASFDSAHAWDHITRVRRLAQSIASVEAPEQKFLVDFGVLMHELIDHKFDTSEEKALELLEKYSGYAACNSDEISILKMVMFDLSFSKKENIENPSIVFQIIRDADRLDAIGAIGIARAFAYGGNKSRPLYEKELIDKSLDFRLEKSHSTLGHFFEKLLKLKDEFYTYSAQQIADKRDETMTQFVVDLQNEIKGIQ